MAEQIEGYRLSPQQKRLWQLQRDLPPLRAQCAIGLDGDLKPEVLREALEAAVNRHEALRTAFQCPPGITLPIQVINETAELAWHVADWGELSGDEEDARVTALFEETEHLRHDFEHGPILSATLITLSPRRNLLHLSLPSLYADAWSLRNLVRETAGTYGALLEGVKQADEVVQYLQFSEWQNDLLEDENAPIGQAYWRGQDVSAALPPAFTFTRKPTRSVGSERKTLDLRLEVASAAEVDALAEKLGADAEAVLLACWHALLWRVTGQSSVVVGHVSTGRKYEDLYDSLGLFAKSLPVRCRFEDGMTFAGAVHQIAESSRTAIEWQEWFDWQAVEPTETTPRYPAIGFRFDQWHSPYSADGISFTLRGQRVRVDRHDLALELVRYDDTLLAQFTYEPALYSEVDVRLLAEQFQTLVHSALANPKAKVAALDLLSENERQCLVVEFNATKAAYPSEKSLHQLFEDQARRTPGADAIIYRDERLTYNELDGRANQLARHLEALGVGPETLVAVACERSPELVVALLGILKAGAAYLPLDLSYPPERLAFMLEDAAVPVLLTQDRLRAALPMCDARVVSLDSDWPEIATASTEEVPARALPDNPAYVIYTSGSTGKPKGVVVSHRGLVNYLSWCSKAYAVGEHGGSVVQSPIGFDLTVTTLFSPLITGRSVLLVPDEQGVEGLKDALQMGHFGLAKLTPSHLEVLNQLLPPESAANSVAALIIGGEALLAEQLAFWREHSPATRLVNEYGPTEAVVGCCIYEATAETLPTGAVPIGRPIANARIYLLDSRMSPTPTYVAGELYIGGDCLARGYLNRPDLTAEKFIPDPFSDEPGARLYRTGDHARHLPGGQIEFLGRVDQQVKIRGFRVELGEIEAVLGNHPGVREALVALRQETPDDQRLVAYVVAAGAEAPTASDLRSHLQAVLPEYMLPAAFVTIEELPLTPNGKVDRSALPAPEGLRPQLAAAYVAPQNETERVISTIWQDVLQIEKVGIYDNFFDLGGHSLLMVRVNRRLREEFDREVSMIDLFKYPTVSALAEFLGQEPQAAAAAAAADSSGKVQSRKDSAAAQKELRERRRQLKARTGA